jgi:hypothetical protein
MLYLEKVAITITASYVTTCFMRVLLFLRPLWISFVLCNDGYRNVPMAVACQKQIMRYLAATVRILWCGTLSFGTKVETFRRNLFCTSSWITLFPWQWIQHVPLKHLYVSTKLCCVTSQNAIVMSKRKSLVQLFARLLQLRNYQQVILE